jgi:hypothetical protein
LASPPQVRYNHVKININLVWSGLAGSLGYRTILYDRLQNGQKIRLSPETHAVAVDKNETMTMTITERMPQ